MLQIPLVNQLNTFLEYIKLESKKLDSGQHLLFELFHAYNFQHINSVEIGLILGMVSDFPVDGSSSEDDEWSSSKLELEGD